MKACLSPKFALVCELLGLGIANPLDNKEEFNRIPLPITDWEKRIEIDR